VGSRPGETSSSSFLSAASVARMTVLPRRGMLGHHLALLIDNRAVALSCRMKMLRLYSNEEGESQFDFVDFTMTLHDDSPPAIPHYFSEPEDAKGWVYVRCPVDWDGKLHPAPRRQIIICTGGTMRITSSLGIERDLSPGSAVLLEDTKGKGHTSTVTSQVPFEAIIVRLE
jgi:hypothetical protein